MLGDKPLPGITIFVITISNFAKDNWAILIRSLCCTHYGNQTAGTNARRSRLRRSSKLRVPLFGDLIRKTAISRSHASRTLVTSGVSIYRR